MQKFHNIPRMYTQNAVVTKEEIATPSSEVPDTMIYTENVSYNFQDISWPKPSLVNTTTTESRIYEDLQEVHVASSYPDVLI